MVFTSKIYRIILANRSSSEWDVHNRELLLSCHTHPCGVHFRFVVQVQVLRPKREGGVWVWPIFLCWLRSSHRSSQPIFSPLR